MVFSEADDKFYGLFAPMVFHYIKKRETAAPPSPFVAYVVAPLLFYHPSSSPLLLGSFILTEKKFTLSIVHHFFGVGSTCAIDAVVAMMTSDLLYY